jgi:hypothetical protein
MRNVLTTGWLALLLLASIAPACGGGAAGDGAASATDALSVDAKVFGLGVDAPTAVASPLFAELHQGWRSKEGFSLLSARTVFAIDGVDAQGHSTYASDLAGLEAWETAVAKGGLAPIVAVAVDHAMDDATFRQRFRDLLDHLPHVQAWGLVNEPDLHPYSVATAVGYYVSGAGVLEEWQAQGGSGSVHLFAGEFSFQDSNPQQLDGSKDYWAAYGDEMLAEVRAGHLAHFPRQWGFHPYWDTTRGNTVGTDAFDAFLAGLEEKAGLADRALRVWLTETGTMMEWGGGACADSGNASAQYDGARAVYAFAARERVDRVYWWQFEQATQCWGGNWDSGMVDWNGAPRPSFCALANLARSQCTGSIVSRDCGGPGKCAPPPPPPRPPPPPPSEATCYVRCCDGTLQSAPTPSNPACRAEYGLCDNHGHGRVKHMEWNGQDVYGPVQCP